MGLRGCCRELFSCFKRHRVGDFYKSWEKSLCSKAPLRTPVQVLSKNTSKHQSCCCGAGSECRPSILPVNTTYHAPTLLAAQSFCSLLERRKAEVGETSEDIIRNLRLCPVNPHLYSVDIIQNLRLCPVRPHLNSVVFIRSYLTAVAPLGFSSLDTKTHL